MGTKKRWTEADIPIQAGRSVLVTGANSGIGMVTAIPLARAGARVSLGCRYKQRGTAATKRVAAAATGPQPELIQVDMADRASIADAVRELGGRTERLDLLVNNAGVASVRDTIADGHEIHFGVNHLGTFALTGSLMPLLLQATNSRVVSMGSLGHWGARIRWDDLNRERGRYGPMLAYNSSKLACLLFAAELDRRAKANGSDLRSVAAHPGMVRTGLAHQKTGGLLAWIVDLSRRVAMHPDVEHGALSQLRAATDTRLRGGEYIGPDGFMERRGWPDEARRRATPRPGRGCGRSPNR